MSSLGEFLTLQTEGSRLTGHSSLPPERPTRSGLNWVANPKAVSGLAYRFQTGSIDRLSIQEDGIKVTEACSIDCGVVNIASSFDGRLVAAACHDGSIRCYDSTSASMSHRWTVPNAHSHISPDLTTAVSSDRSDASAACGPVRSFEFAPDGYDLLIVDNQKGICIYNAATSTPNNLITNQKAASSAAWGPSVSDNAIAIGNSDGSIEIFKFQDSNNLNLISSLGCPYTEEEGFSCTHLDWGSTRLVAGLCRVTPEDDEPDEGDEDDTATYEALMFSTSMDVTTCQSTRGWTAHDDVVGFFGVPKSGRHVYFTSFLNSKQNIFVVATNVGSDVGIIAQEEDSEWKLVELQDGANATTPTTEDDEYCYPVGIAIIRLESGAFRMILGATDGSISNFSFHHETDPNCFSSDLPVPTASMPDSPVETVEASEPPELASEPPVAEAPAMEETEPQSTTPGFSFGATASGPTEETKQPTTPGSAFGSTAASGTATAFSFGSSSSSAFGAGVSAPAAVSGQGTPSAFGSPAGAFSFGTPSPFGASIATPTENAKAPSFGSPPGGSLFGSKAGTTGSFGALSSSGQASNTFGSSFGTTSSLGAPAASPAATPSKGPSFGSPSSGSIFGSGGTAGGFSALSSSGKVSSSFGSGGAAFGTPPPSSSTTRSPFAANLANPRLNAATKTSDIPEDSDESETSTGSDDTPKAARQESAVGAFGSGSKAPTFSFTSQSSPQPFGAKPSSSESPFAAFTPSNTTATTTASPFGAFGSSTTTTASSFAKPLFGQKKTEPVIKADTKPSASAPEPAPASTTEKTVQPEPTTIAGKKAVKVFDECDTDKIGTVPSSSFESLLYDIGESFYGDEFEAQLAIVDPSRSGNITRTAFIDWYTDLAEGGDDGSLDTADREERAEEEANAKEKFAALGSMVGGVMSIPSSSFGDLIESLGTDYNKEAHKSNLKRLTRDNDMIVEADFLAWYVDWLFGSDDEDDGGYNTDDEAEDPPEASQEKPSLGNMFKVEAGSWKCDVCSVQNKAAANKCVSCETPRPGAGGHDRDDDSKPASVPGAIGSGGFTFGGTSDGSIGSGGFSFVAPARAPGPTTETKAAAPAAASDGFTFGGGATGSSSTGGFTFGKTTLPSGSSVPPAASRVEPGNVDKAKAPSSFYPPLSTAAPKPFSLVSPTARAAAVADAGKATNPSVPVKTVSTTGAGKKAAKAFDKLNSDKNGSVPSSSFENLLYEIGENFYGDVYDEQLALVDPTHSNRITRAAFIDWYTNLVEGDSGDNDSLDTADREERAEEEANAREKFRLLATADGFDGSWSIPTSAFGDLIISLGSDYCEEAHISTLKRLTKNQGMIKENDFLAWYVEWLFGDDDNEEEEEDQDNTAVVGGKGKSEQKLSLGSLFKTDADNWRCDLCSVSNKKDAKICVSCETPRPGMEGDQESDKKDEIAPSNASIGSGGFTFGSGTSASIGSSGFSFSAPLASGSNSAGINAAATGFSFGTSAAGSGSSALRSNTTGGFQFGVPSKSPSQIGTQGNLAAETKPSSSAAPFPPMSLQAPTPFSEKAARAKTAEEVKSAAKPVSSSAAPFPPISKKAPTPFSASSGAKPSPSPGAPFPPMATKAPKPFGAPVGAKTSTSSAPFPPLSAKAPTPFGASSGVKPSASSAPFPPLSAKAPTPFGGSSGATPAGGAGGAAPTNSLFKTVTAAKPGSESKQPTKPASSSASGGYPPIATKSPTPFSSIGAKPASSSASGAYPPMASKSPTPFSSMGKTATVAKRASSSSVAPFPPMSLTAPKPFSSVASSKPAVAAAGSGNASSLGRADLRDKAPPAASPTSMPLKATTFPGIGMQSTTSANQQPSSAGQESALVVSQTSSTKKQLSRGVRVDNDRTYSSEAARQFVSLTEAMEQTLAEISRGYDAVDASNNNLEKRINALAGEVQAERDQVLKTDLWLAEQKKENTFLLGRKTDSSRQVGESKRLVSNLISKTKGLSVMLESQPLDYESEQHRRKFATSIRSLNGRLVLLRSRIEQLDCPEKARVIMLGVASLYKKVNDLGSAINAMSNKVESVKKTAPMLSIKQLREPSKGRSTYGLEDRTPKTKRQRPRALFSPSRVTASKKSESQVEIPLSEKWKDIESSLHAMGNENASTVRIGGLSKIRKSFEDTRKPDGSSVRRNLGVSLLLSPQKAVPALPPATASATSTSIQLYSPTPSMQPRSGWDRPSTLDQNRAQQLSVPTQGELKEVSIAEASRPTLMALGTTPEKINASLDIKRNDSVARSSARRTRSSAPIPAANTSSNTAEPSEVKSNKPTATFPPMPSNPPIAVSDMMGKAKKASATPTYPPLSATAPKPFSAHGSTGAATAIKPKSSSAGDKAASANPSSDKGNGSNNAVSAFGGMTGLGDSLFSSGTTSDSIATAPQAKLTSSTTLPRSNEPDYEGIMTTFYQKHNPGKVLEIKKTLEKYKVRSSRLAEKYAILNPIVLTT